MRFETWRFKGTGKTLAEPSKSIEKSFVDWESHAFGFGYGTGEEHVLRAIKAFLDAFGVDDRPNSYNYETLEKAVTAPVAWLLINRLCGVDIIEYGTSPRYGWLTEEGEALRKFIDGKTVEELETICCDRTEDDPGCMPDACNCGPEGYDEKRICYNPFWSHHHS
jgi:hypothetical protein